MAMLPPPSRAPARPNAVLNDAGQGPLDGAAAVSEVPTDSQGVVPTPAETLASQRARAQAEFKRIWSLCALPQ